MRWISSRKNSNSSLMKLVNQNLMWGQPAPMSSLFAVKLNKSNKTMDRQIENPYPDTATKTRFRPRFTALKNSNLAAIFLLPTLLLLLAMNIFPLIWSLYLSFTSYNANTDPSWLQAEWVGFANYANLLVDPRVWQHFVISMYFVVPAVTVQFFLGFGIALLLNRPFPGRGIVTTLILVPMMLSPIVVGLFWRFMFQSDIGVINYFLTRLGFEPVFWLTQTAQARLALVVVDVWQWTPFVMLISLAGLAAVPKYLYEAAEVDQASAWFRFRHITLPIVSPLLAIAVLFRLMDAYKLFDLVWVLTKGGGPGRDTMVLPVYLYRTAFSFNQTGEAAALGYIMLVVIIALANLLIRLINQQTNES